jgi:hypothetical protein
VTLSFQPVNVTPPEFHVCVASMTGVEDVTVPPVSVMLGLFVRAVAVAEM